MTISLDPVLQWLDDNLVLVVVIGGSIVVLVLALVILAKIVSGRHARLGLPIDETSPADGPQARALAVGLITIADNGGLWNDPEAKAIAGNARAVAQLRGQWGIYTPEEWREAINRLIRGKRASPLRDEVLAVRASLAGSLGHRPYAREWLAAFTSRDKATRAEIKELIEAVVAIEKRMAKADGAALPDDHIIRDVSAFAYSQAVALAVWGVALGVASRAEALGVAADVSALARSEYSSWGEFGLSTLLGRAMFLGNNRYDADSFDAMMDGAFEAYRYALNPASVHPGPWTYLAW